MTTRHRHSLDDELHRDPELDIWIALSEDLGSYPAGSSLHEFLLALDALVTTYENAAHIYSFTADAKLI